MLFKGVRNYLFGYIYLTTDLLTNKLYVGQKKSSVFLKEDYVGSGRIITNILQKLKKDGTPVTERFKTKLLRECDSEEELNEYEEFYINKYNTKIPNGYNIRNGGQFVFDEGVLSDLIKEAYKAHSNIGMKNKKQTQHQKDTVRQYMKNRIVSEDSRLKMSQSHKGLSHPTYPKGSKFMHKPDEEVSVVVAPDKIQEYLDSGYVLGRKPYSKSVREKQAAKYSSGTYVYKGTKIILVDNKDIESYLLEGWCIGHPKNLSSKNN